MSGPAVQIRDAVCALLADFGDYESPRKRLAPQLQPDRLPSLTVFVAGERMTSDGDPNASVPEYVSNVTVGIVLTRGFEDTETLEGQIDDDVETLLATILSDPDFMRLAPDSLHEGASGITAKRLFPQDGEAYFCKAYVEMTFVTRRVYEPVIPDHYKGMTITARPLAAPGTPGASAPTVSATIDEADWA